MMCKIEDHQIPIKGIIFESGEFYEVGHQGITAITPYFENGEMSQVTWLAVFKDGNADINIISRIPCRMVQILYV